MVIIEGNEAINTCEMCGKKSHLPLSDEELFVLRSYLVGGGYIQNWLATLNKCEREFVKTGFCPKCQELIFGNGETKRIYLS